MSELAACSIKANPYITWFASPPPPPFSWHCFSLPTRFKPVKTQHNRLPVYSLILVKQKQPKLSSSILIKRCNIQISLKDKTPFLTTCRTWSSWSENDFTGSHLLRISCFGGKFQLKRMAQLTFDGNIGLRIFHSFFHRLSLDGILKRLPLSVIRLFTSKNYLRANFWTINWQVHCAK